jgi:hypothetical protein
MVTVTNTRKVLSVEGKIEVIQHIKNGKKKVDVSRALGPVISTLQTLWKNIPKIISMFEQKGL